MFNNNNMFIRIYIYNYNWRRSTRRPPKQKTARAYFLAREPFSTPPLSLSLLSEHNLLLLPDGDDDDEEKRKRKRQAREREREVVRTKKLSSLMVSAVFLGILEQTQIASPRPLLSRPSLQVRILRLLLPVTVFRVRERVHAKRAARWNREESYRSPLVHFSCFSNKNKRIHAREVSALSERERDLFSFRSLRARTERENEKKMGEIKNVNLVPISSSMLPPPLMLLFCCLGEKTPLFLSDSARRSAFCAVARNMIYVL